MSKVHDFCARIQNAFRASHQYAVVPETKMHLRLASILCREGFVSSVQRGNHVEPDEQPTQTTPGNIPTRRYWLKLKYSDNRPVLEQMKCISKGSKRVYMNVNELQDLSSGKRAKFIQPLQFGEIIIVSTPKGVLEIKDAITLKAGGEVICRAK